MLLQNHLDSISKQLLRFFSILLPSLASYSSRENACSYDSVMLNVEAEAEVDFVEKNNMKGGKNKKKKSLEQEQSKLILQLCFRN